MNEIKPIEVLIVEDHEFTRVGLRMSLDQVPGLKIVGEAEDGEAAVQLVLQARPHVVLMDIELPAKNGIEATKEIKKIAPETQVIMLTSHTSEPEIFAALGAGANGYCLKNTSSKQLAIVIETVAAGAAWLDPGIANCVLHAYAGENGGTNSPDLNQARKKVQVSLSPRETDVLRLVANGLSNQQIAVRLDIGLETVKTHMRHVMEKLTASDRTDAAIKAVKQGLV